MSRHEAQMDLFDTNEFEHHRKSYDLIKRLARGLSDFSDEDCYEIASQNPQELFKSAFEEVKPTPGVPTDIEYYKKTRDQRDILFAFWKGQLLQYLDSRLGEVSMETTNSPKDKDLKTKLFIGKTDTNNDSYKLVLDSENERAELKFEYSPTGNYIDIGWRWPRIEYRKFRDGFFGRGYEIESYEFGFRQADLTFAKQMVTIPDQNGYSGFQVKTAVEIPRFTDHIS